MRRPIVLASVVLLAAALAGSPAGASAPSKKSTTTITLMTHDSFAVSKSVMKDFTKRTGIRVKVLPSGDAGAALNQAILTKSNPLGDVFFGVDNTFLGRAIDAGIFVPYRSPELSHVPSGVQLDRRHRLTPVDTGDVCINFDNQYFATRKLSAPKTLDDLTRPAYKGLLVVENPATSSPGLAFALASIAKFGQSGWRDYWKRLRDNDVKVVDGWEQAYNSDFSGSAGKGNYPLVVSYASSPPAEVVAAKPTPSEPPTRAVLDTCFRQIEFVGVLKGTHHVKAARQLVDFMLTPRFQADMPLQMFVFPIRAGVKLPPVFAKFAQVAPNPLSLPAAEIARNRDRWIQQWTDTVLR